MHPCTHDNKSVLDSPEQSVSSTLPTCVLGRFFPPHFHIVQKYKEKPLVLGAQISTPTLELFTVHFSIKTFSKCRSQMILPKGVVSVHTPFQGYHWVLNFVPLLWPVRLRWTTAHGRAFQIRKLTKFRVLHFVWTENHVQNMCSRLNPLSQHLLVVRHGLCIFETSVRIQSSSGGISP